MSATLHYPAHRYNTRYKAQVEKMGKPVFLAWAAGENKRILEDMVRVRNELVPIPFLLKKAWNLRWLPQSKAYVDKLLKEIRTKGLDVFLPIGVYRPMINKKNNYQPVMTQIKSLIFASQIYVNKFKKFYKEQGTK